MGYAVSLLASLGPRASLAPVEKLSNDLQEAIKKGDTATSQKLAADAKIIVEEDKKALRTDSLVTQYGTGMIKTAGLFVPSKAGYALSGLAYALDQAKPGDSLNNQAVDCGLGLTKGLALKGSFQYVGAMDLGIAAKAVSFGISSRVTDMALTRQTYAEGNGYSALTGLSRTVEGSFNRTALASDVITFGLAHGALSQINSATGGALRNSPFWSMVATGGVFGVSTGSVHEITRQHQGGESFDFQKVLTSAALTGVTDMIAAGPGGKMTSMRASAMERQNTSDQTPTGAEQTKIAPVLQRNFPGSTSREFQLVNGDQQVVDLLRNSPDKMVYAAVREVSLAGALGPQKNMLIQHIEAGKDGASALAVNRSIYGIADLLATCNPKLLPEDLQAKHIIPSAESLWLTQETGGRLRFSIAMPTDLKPNESQPVKLGRTVSEMLLGPETPKHLEDTHDKAAMAQAMRNFRTPARYFNGGADSIAFELPDRNILKITDKGWDPTWGSREIWTPKGMKAIDAPMIQKPQTIDLRAASITWFIQKRMLSPVTERDLNLFDSQIEQDGTFKFWDNDFKSHGKNQLGFDPKTRELYVLDYDSVRLPHLVPKDAEVGGSTWFANRYLMHHDH